MYSSMSSSSFFLTAAAKAKATTNASITTDANAGATNAGATNAGATNAAVSESSSAPRTWRSPTLGREFPLPRITDTFSPELRACIFDYLDSLDEYEVKAYLVAFDHLGSSFSIDRSNGFKAWLKARPTT